MLKRYYEERTGKMKSDASGSEEKFETVDFDGQRKKKLTVSITICSRRTGKKLHAHAATSTATRIHHL